jgi:hypothetical protein
MNASVGNASVGFTYFDLLDGEYMACSGAPGALAYQPTCFYLRYVLGTIAAVESLFFARLCLMYKRRLNLQHAARLAKTATTNPNGVQSPSTLPNGEDVRSIVLVGPTALKLLQSRYANYVCIVAILVSSASFSLISGFGTVYPSQSAPGKVGDLFMALLYGFIVQFSGLKENESNAFQAIVRIPGIGRVQKRSCGAQAHVLHAQLQKFLPLPAALTMWILLVVRVLTRSQFVTVLVATDIASGVRMFYISVSKRLFTLSKVRDIQQIVGDTGDGGRKVEVRYRLVALHCTVLSCLARVAARLAPLRSRIVNDRFYAEAIYVYCLRCQLLLVHEF